MSASKRSTRYSSLALVIPKQPIDIPYSSHDKHFPSYLVIKRNCTY